MNPKRKESTAREEVTRDVFPYQVDDFTQENSAQITEATRPNEKALATRWKGFKTSPF